MAQEPMDKASALLKQREAAGIAQGLAGRATPWMAGEPA